MSITDEAPRIPRGLRALLAELYPGSRQIGLDQLGPDAAGEESGATTKGAGYGVPVRVRLELPSGKELDLVWHVAVSDDFGHDRRSDRAQELLLAFDTSRQVPCHARAVDVGAIRQDGRLLSLRDAGEVYLLTTWAPGRPYAEDLRRIAAEGAGDEDERRCDALAAYLVELHSERRAREAGYRRAIRDLVGHGEGLFGIVDSYGAAVPGAPPERLRAIERQAVEWRWRLRDRASRLRRTHGDFHPFNILFDEGGRLTLIDASRGGQGDPADDVTCLALNYVFFALDRPGAWRGGLAALWSRFWTAYLEASGDAELLEVAAPFLAWRALVMASPTFYPAMTGDDRDRLLGLAERALAADRFDPGSAETLFP